ncbi:MAG: bifunctional proline dehydrogenase/L-glutamate gamma-semialdehyde dehydrogenase PutA [Alphaproteobacteria bacterium]|nr:bifunctional proline dehydrogenase/L-glutamate gamma-semialdehyde dehydrogenase PutA [Alphaproteobacteria bacterium]
MNKSLHDHLYADETEILENLLNQLAWDEVRADRIFATAKGLVERVRARKVPAGQLETFLRQYGLDTEEGLALMTLAEALLRIPDKKTANVLIRDKVAAADWLASAGQSNDWMTKMAGYGLSLTRKTLDGVLARLGEPVIREAIIAAIGVMGRQFVLGQDIEDALKRAKPYEKKSYRFSYDVLGEGARTAEDAERYFESYVAAIKAVGAHPQAEGQRRSGISVKLSALHPRYLYGQKERCVPDLADRLAQLCALASDENLTLTVDAEEVGRLELSLEIIQRVLKNPGFNKDWAGFGLAVQAYQKRCFPLIDEVAGLARDNHVRLQARLVKGAYWDTEIKYAQVSGFSDFPVFTRKANTDVSYLACAQRMFSHADRVFPMFATHNAHTIAAILDFAKESGAAFEFQRLHGMGETLYDTLKEDHQEQVCIYAPVGPHQDLLPYLVRRLLENGANSSFVNRLLNPAEPAALIVADPVEKVRNYESVRHPAIALPPDLYKGEAPVGRINSRGLDLQDRASADELSRAIALHRRSYESAPLIGGKIYKEGEGRTVENPADHKDSPGKQWGADESLVNLAFEAADNAFGAWSRTPGEDRARILEKFADLLEDNREELIALCVREAGKTLPDGIAEVREAVDFARYYANRGRLDFSAEGMRLPGPTGESNILTQHGRGVFVCISPWNFPLAIFTGQVIAALMAGNTVLAKPAEQTSLIAMKTVQLMHEAGIPLAAVNLVPGKGSRIGPLLTGHKDVAGVCFTGSTEVAQGINRTLAAKSGPIVPLIAETGGMNAMIVDSSALPEQVVDDALLSAFGSAGQRCSALRILCVQEDVADKIIPMLKGAMKELRVGDPALLSSDIGPVIDDHARAELEAHRTKLEGWGELIQEVPIEPALKKQGSFFAPCAFLLDNTDLLEREVFGPILHVIRFRADDLEDLIRKLNGKGYGLTFGLHTRVASAQARIVERMNVGNVYVNRSIIGAVVGSQPFGGCGLSGTGPKAGGPHYLARFAPEKVVSVNTTAAGGNATLVSIGE